MKKRNIWDLCIRELPDTALVPGSEATQRDLAGFKIALTAALSGTRSPATVAKYVGGFFDGLALRGTYCARAQERLAKATARILADRRQATPDDVTEVVNVDAAAALSAAAVAVTKATSDNDSYMAKRLQASLALMIGAPGLRGTSAARVRASGWKAGTVAEPHLRRPISESWPPLNELAVLYVPQSAPDKGAQLRGSSTATVSAIPVIATRPAEQCAARVALQFLRDPQVTSRAASAVGDALFLGRDAKMGIYLPISASTIRARLCDFLSEFTGVRVTARWARKAAFAFNIAAGMDEFTIATLQNWSNTATARTHYNHAAASRVAMEQRSLAASVSSASGSAVSDLNPIEAVSTTDEDSQDFGAIFGALSPSASASASSSGTSSRALACVPARITAHGGQTRVNTRGLLSGMRSARRRRRTSARVARPDGDSS